LIFAPCREANFRRSLNRVARSRKVLNLRGESHGAARHALVMFAHAVSQKFFFCAARPMAKSRYFVMH
jgi:hypothetical protein